MINQERLIKTFLELVQIDSPSGEERKMAEYVKSRLEQLGGSTEYDTYGNVIAKFPGKGEPLLLNAHLDTVEPGKGIKPRLEGDKILTDGTTVLGGDPKAGVAAILETITSLKEDNKEHQPIEVVLTLGEETGLLGAVNLDYSRISAKKGITIDGEWGVENVTLSASGYTSVDVTITGRGYHASEPEKGISAIEIAGNIISQLHLGRIDADTTANIGLITGGTARNAVPEQATFQAEIRSRTIEGLNAHTKHFEDVFEKIKTHYPQAKIEVKVTRDFNPYAFTKEHSMLQQIQKALGAMGLEAKLEHSGGGTDVNIFHTHGIDAICIGNGDYEAHTTREYVLISELVETAQFCEKLVTVLTESK